MYCVSHNKFNVFNFHLLYGFIDVPQSPHSLDSEDVYSRNLTLIWAIPHDNNAPILGNFIFYRNPFFIENGSDVLLTDDDNVGEFIVENLHPGEFYNFTIIAFNEEGNSAESDTYRVRTLEEGMLIINPKINS